MTFNLGLQDFAGGVGTLMWLQFV